MPHNLHGELCQLSLYVSLPAPVRKLTVFATVALLGMVSPAVNAAARKPVVHKHPRLHALAHAFVNAALPGVGLIPEEEEEVPDEGEKYELKLAHPYTGEVLSVVYRIGDTYMPNALAELNLFLRDSHNQQVNAYDPRTFDVLHTMLVKLGKPDGVIDILSAYRSKETNDALRASGTTNAAEHSQHIDAKAIDFRVPGVPAARLREAALSLEAGGVGYYPKSQFVHVDVGPVRQWTYSHAKHTARKRSRRARAKQS